jgi:3-methyladenine DNA glycosylase AlkC
MPAKLKDYLDEKAVRFLANEIASVHPLDTRRFVREATRGFEALELTERAAQVADALAKFLPRDVPEALDVVVRALGADEERAAAFDVSVFRFFAYPIFIAKYGLDHFEPSMRAQYELTKRFTSEGCIRAFIERYPERTYARLEEWATDPNAHVRRLVSEGTRPRLPWARRLVAYQKDPRPVIALLDRLKDDESLYVRRSVANNVNDIAKDHPSVAIEVCRRWMKGASAERRWIVRHALRTLVKRGDRAALEVLGFGDKPPSVWIEGAKLSAKRVAIGDSVVFELVLVNGGKKTERILVDYAVHFVKADGRARPKVFKLTTVELAPNERVALRRRVSFKTLSTRKPRPGRHRIELLLNGAAVPVGGVEVVARTQRTS